MAWGAGFTRQRGNEMIELRASTYEPSRALEYQAPFVIERLLKNYSVQSEQEAHDLFLELKRYLVFARARRDRIYGMHSSRVDEAWHQFVLFTHEYIEFSQRYFGRYIQHYPGNSAEASAGAERRGHRSSRAIRGHPRATRNTLRGRERALWRRVAESRACSGIHAGRGRCPCARRARGRARPRGRDLPRRTPPKAV